MKGLHKTLELLPCGSDIPPTVELYGSGIVKEEVAAADSDFFNALHQSALHGLPLLAWLPGG